MSRTPETPEAGQGTPGVSRERRFAEAAPPRPDNVKAEPDKEGRKETAPRVRPWLSGLPILSSGAAQATRATPATQAIPAIQAPSKPARTGGRAAPRRPKGDGADRRPAGNPAAAPRLIGQAPGALRAYRDPAGTPNGAPAPTPPPSDESAPDANPIRALSRELVTRGMPADLVADLLAETVAEFGAQVLSSERDARLAFADVLLSRIPTVPLIHDGGDTPAPLTGLYVVTGPAGAGKSALIGRLALAAARAGQADVVLVNTQAERIGAAAQANALGAVFGYDVEHLYTPDELRASIDKRGKKALFLVETGGWTPAVPRGRWTWPWRIKGASVVTCVSATSQGDDIKEALAATCEAAGATTAVLCRVTETRNVLPALGALAALRQTVGMVAPGANLADTTPAPHLAAVVTEAICGHDRAKGA